ncbi:RNA polymerase sigma factor [Patescibacteria group bacterium]|nr:RNA polymerase sigma factor [Patescibacteria group bacterium]
MINVEEKTDEELVVYIREENKEYFSYILDRYESKLRRYLYKFIHDLDDVDDLLQNTFLNAYINLQSFNSSKKFSSWIYRIAHNLAINLIKKNKFTISIDENELLAFKLESKISVKKEFQNKELSDQLSKAINKLPEKYKVPFVLKYFEDRSYEEISDILRKPKNTVGTMISRAKDILKNELDQYDR